MRSASSKTKNDTLDKSTVPNLIWDNKRPRGSDHDIRTHL